MSISPLNDPPMTICPVSSPDDDKNQAKCMTESQSALNMLEVLNEAHHSNNQDILWHLQNFQVDGELPSFAQYIYERVDRVTIKEIHDSLHKCRCCKRHCNHHHIQDDNLGGRCPCKCRHYRRQLREVIDFIDSV
jgi:NADPH-dependent glutamate synthase beta subunit-like oxidoreductase